MAKRSASETSKVVEKVLERLRSRQVVKTKRTLVLSKEPYEIFEKLCRSEGLFPSQVVDEFIALFIEQKAPRTR